jgi:hypothetical protein
MTNAVALTRISHATAEGPLTLAGIPGYTVYTERHRRAEGTADTLAISVKHGARCVGGGDLREASDDNDPGVTHWWGYPTIQGRKWCVSGLRGSGVLEFREDVRLPAKAGWGA